MNMLKDRKIRVPRDKETLQTGNISRITVDSELSCGTSKKASDTTNQATNQTSNYLDKPTSSQSCLKSLVVNETVTGAEIMWALEVVLKKYSLNLCSDKKDPFQAVKLLRSLLVEVQSVPMSLTLALHLTFVHWFKTL